MKLNITYIGTHPDQLAPQVVDERGMPVPIEAVVNEIERLRAELAVANHENTRWETVCDELENELAAARALLREATIGVDAKRFPAWQQEAMQITGVTVTDIANAVEHALDTAGGE